MAAGTSPGAAKPEPVNRDHFFEFLYPFQDRVLHVLSELDTGLYLTGGTAASRGYLQHRFSDDLDLFANDAPDFGLWADRAIHGLSVSADWESRVLLREERFVRIELTLDGKPLKIELINDVPSRVGHVTLHPRLGPLDSAENILANKLTAVADRREPKDLADIWGFCVGRNLPIAEALEGAQGKAAGLFPADLARVILSATPADWELVRWIEAPPLDVFLADLKRLGESLILVE